MAFNSAQKYSTEANAPTPAAGVSPPHPDSRKSPLGRGFMVGQGFERAPQASPQRGGIRRIKDPDEARTAGNAQLQQAAFALPNTAIRLPRGVRSGTGGSRAGKSGADILLSMGAFETPMEHPKESTAPVPKVLHQFGVNDSDSRWNPTLSGTRGFTRYEAQNRSWKVVGGTVGVMDADGNPTGEAPQRHTMGELLRGINERRTNKARDFYAHTHAAIALPSGTPPHPVSPKVVRAHE